MEENIALLKDKFESIKKMGFVESTRKGSSGIGKTFEDLIGKEEDSSYNPDFCGIEIKTKNIKSARHTTFFSLTPKGKEEYEIKRLVKTYGYPDADFKQHKVFSAAIYGNCLTRAAAKHLMGLNVDYKARKIYLKIISLNMELIEEYVYWDFDAIEERVNKKLKYLAFITASRKFSNGKVYFHYKNIEFYRLKSFDTFLKLIELGVVRVLFHIGIVKSGERLGELHDRGTSFQIQEKDLTKLFDKISI